MTDFSDNYFILNCKNLEVKVTLFTLCFNMYVDFMQHSGTTQLLYVECQLTYLETISEYHLTI